jgi:hypothetical protein
MSLLSSRKGQAGSGEEPWAEAEPEPWRIGAHEGTTFALLASRFAIPAGHLRCASSAHPSASVVSSDFRVAQPHPCQKNRLRCARGITAATEHRPPGSIGAGHF